MNQKPKLIRADYQIFEHQKEKLKKLSEKTGYTISELIRKAIELLNYGPE
jgi:predicted DNA-binding protein